MKTVRCHRSLSTIVFSLLLIPVLSRLRRGVDTLLAIGLLAPFWAEAQVVDTAAVRREVDSLITVNRNLIRQKDYNGALQAVELAESKSSGTLGKQSSLYARCLFNHGRTLQMMRRLEDAEAYYLEAKSIWKKLPPGDPDYESTLNNLGALYNGQHRFDEAEENLLEVIAIREQTKHPDLAKNLVNLGNTYLERGRYEAAERCHAKVVSIRAGLTGKKGFEYANALNGLATAQQRLGRFENAETLYLEALPLFKDTLGENDPKYLSYLGNLAQVYSDMGRFEKAEPVMQQIIQMIGQDHPQYGVNINNLGRLYYYTGRYAEAEAMFKKALDVKEKQFTKQHMSYVQSLDNLASVYIITNRYADAELLYKEALTIHEKLNGKTHPDFAFYLNNLGTLNYLKGAYKEAETAYTEANMVKANSLGINHPSYATGLRNLALLYHAWNKPETAAKYYLDANTNYRRIILDAASVAGENGMLAYLDMYRQFFDELQSFAVSHPSPALQIAALENSLLFKEMLLEKQRSLTRAIERTDNQTKDTYERWLAYRRLLAAEYAKPVADRKQVNEYEQLAEGLEKSLVRSLAAFEELKSLPGWEKVGNTLKRHEAAVEFVRYQYYTPYLTDKVLYGAYLILPGKTAPVFVPLCEESQLSALLPTRKEPLHQYLQKLYAPVRNDGNKSLYELVWAPMEALLSSNYITKVYFAPAGILHRINLEALTKDKSDTILADRYDLVLLGSIREVHAEGGGKGNLPSSALVYGGIYYDLNNPGAVTQEQGVAHSDPSSGKATSEPSGRTMSNNWAYLPGTEQLGLWLHEQLKQQGILVTFYAGRDASEASLKSFAQTGISPDLLHIGTHGYFYPDPAKQKTTVKIDQNAPVFTIEEHPFIRSGLLFAGAKEAWNLPGSLPADNDGILTAYEVSQMDLKNTDLVVLSACETGLGDIKGNEGVYGLQRAFRIAGAKNVLMSLWKVSDEATALLLNHFYENWLQKGLPVRAALEEAQSWMRGQELYRNPYFWAGFVLVGE